MASGELGVTLMHEHIFVRNQELEVSLEFEEWDEQALVARAIEGLTSLWELGVRTVVDLTVPGLGRDPVLVERVAASVPVNIVAATGWYGAAVLPPYFQHHGPGRLIAGADPLEELMLRDITTGIGRTGIKAAIIKVSTSDSGMTLDERRLLAAAGDVAAQTGVAITTHSNPRARTGLEQQRFLKERGFPLERLVIGHSGDTDDVDHLRALMDEGSTLGFDRFGMAHVHDDQRRVATLVELIALGYADRIVLSHDTAFFSHVTPPSWRRRNTPDWNMTYVPNKVLPKLRAMGVSDAAIEQMLVHNPRRILGVASGSDR